MCKLIWVGLLISIATLAGCDRNNIPPLQGRINDQTGTLSGAEVAKLEERIKGEEQISNNQIAVLLVKTIDEDISAFSIKVAEAWKIGQKGKDNGILLVIVTEKREIRIEVGYGLEGRLTDGISGEIIRNDIAPRLKEKQYYAGIDAGLIKIAQAIKGEYVASPAPPPGPNLIGYGLVLLVILIISALCSTIHQMVSGTVASITTLIATQIFFGFIALSLFAAVIAFIIGCFAQQILHILVEIAAHSGGSRSSGGSSGYSGGGGGFGGGGASGRY